MEDCDTQQCVNEALQRTLADAIDALRTEQGSCDVGTACWSLERARRASERQSAELSALASQIAKLPDPGSVRLAAEMSSSQKAIDKALLSMVTKREQADQYADSIRTQAEKLRSRLSAATRFVESRGIRNQINDLEYQLAELSSVAESLVIDLRTTGGSAVANQALSELQRGNEVLAIIESTIERSGLKRPDDPYSERAGRPGLQLLPDHALRAYYGEDTDIQFAVVTVPDPRVPRLRRNFDLIMGAITRAFATRNFVFDRYYFPWSQHGGDHLGLIPREDLELLRTCQKLLATTGSDGIGASGNPPDALLRRLYEFCLGNRELGRSDYLEAKELRKQQKTCATSKATTDKPDDQTTISACGSDLLEMIDQRLNADASLTRLALPVLSKDFGVVTYRYDAWRYANDHAVGTQKAVKIFGIYLVADRGSSGVQADALAAAIEHVRSQQAGPAQPDPTGSSQPVHIIGPISSGSINSLRLVLAGIPDTGFFVTVPSATANTNRRFCKNESRSSAVSVQEPQSDAEFCSTDKPNAVWQFLAPTDKMKFQEIEAIGTYHGLGREEMFLLAENTTWGRAFGQGLCAHFHRNAIGDCPSVSAGYFPANIWETRIADADSTRGNGAETHVPDVRHLVSDTRELRLDADLGSEYPPSFSLHVSARSMELALERTMYEMKGEKPKLIVIAATDIRDQLFLIRRTRSVLPGSLIVVPEADILLAHPDYLDATRGAQVLASHPLKIEEGSARGEYFAKDDAALFFEAVRQQVEWRRNQDPAPVQDNSATAKDLGAAFKPHTVDHYVVSRFGLQPTSARAPVSWTERLWVWGHKAS
ncbi:MAG: hypothetical protein KDI51_15610, partial [Xanthomonadales bacterium]|nr:hypothetical protein [Xanthomonadales bacterium]